MVNTYKRLPVPPGIEAEIETTMAIEVEETHAPELDYSSVKEFLKSRPPPKTSIGQRKVVKSKKPSLVLDFSSVREVILPVLPRVTTTYIYREKVTVANEWHLMLLQFKDPSCGLGILFYVPGTELWSFVDVSVPGSHPQSALPGNRFVLPLDLIAWQIFDFFTHRVINHTLNTKEGFAPLSLRCPDETLAKLLSSLFFNLGLPLERQIGISKQNQNQIPMKYRGQIATLTNKIGTRVPVGSFKTMLTCPGCFGLFTRIDTSLDLCNICSEGYQQNLGNTLPDHEDLCDKEANSSRDSKGFNFTTREIHQLVIGHLPQSFHFTRKRNTGLVEKPGQGGRLNKGDPWGPQAKLRGDPSVSYGSIPSSKDHSQDRPHRDQRSQMGGGS